METDAASTGCQRTWGNQPHVPGAPRSDRERDWKDSACVDGSDARGSVYLKNEEQVASIWTV